MQSTGIGISFDLCNRKIIHKYLSAIYNLLTKYFSALSTAVARGRENIQNLRIYYTCLFLTIELENAELNILQLQEEIFLKSFHLW